MSNGRLTVLFVDDEARLLEGMVRMLRPYRNEWEVLTAGGGDEALAILASRPVDVLVSDMRMPGMNGAELLERVSDRFPGVVRFILSGQADRESLLRSIGSTHQYLAKPCDSLQIRRAVERAYHLRRFLEVSSLTSLVSRIHALPSLPDIYFKIRAELQVEDPSIARIAELVARDIGLSSKLLQVANSGRFARDRAVFKIDEAVQLIGIDTLRPLVLASHLFSACPVDLLSINDLWRHGLAVAQGAYAVASVDQQSAFACDCSYSAGLLHDCGLLLLATHLPAEFAQVRAAAAGMDWLDAERVVLGATHQELGAYLLGLWGLPDELVEAVAHHHRPSESLTMGFSPLAAVHVAESAVIAADGALPWEVGCLPDERFAEAQGVRDRISAWRAAADAAATMHKDAP